MTLGPLLIGIYVFVLAGFVGFEMITKVPPTLHTPLMSGSNAISGITLIGAVISTKVDRDAETRRFDAAQVRRSIELTLEALGVELGPRNGVVVDDDFGSSVPSIHAVGDVIDHVQLTPVAVAEGMHFAHRFYGSGGHRIDYANIATAVFCQPELATVGLTEEEAWHRCQDVRVYKSVFTPLKLSLSERKEHTIVKLVVDASNDLVVGCHMAGHGAAEIIQGLAVALKAGATKSQFDATMGIHPTSAEEFVTLR